MQYQDQEITHTIIAAALEVHRILGPGLLESVYKVCLCKELDHSGLKYKCEVFTPIIYKNEKLDCGFRIDLLIEDKIIVELKSIESILPVHMSQLLTYLRLMNRQVGLMINFNVPILKQGIRRQVLNASETKVDQAIPDWVI